MERESYYDIDELDQSDPSAEYFRKKKKSNVYNYTYFPPEESEQPHY